MSSTSRSGVSDPRQRRSAPAATAATAAAGMPRVPDAPIMSSASVTTTPSNPSRPRSTSPRIVCENVATVSGSKAGTLMCDVMIALVPAVIAAENGTSSRSERVAASAVTTGSETWESVEVSPCPGKCFAVLTIPAASSPLKKAMESMLIWRGSSEKALGPIT